MQTNKATDHQNANCAWSSPIAWESPWPTFAAEEKEITPVKDQKPSDESNECHDADFYTKKSADAAISQAKYAEWQFYLGIPGLIASGLAALFTAFAAIKAGAAAESAANSVAEAKRSAQISEDTLNHQRRATEIDQRPWIVINAIPAGDITFSENYMHIKIAVIIENVGKTPAHSVYCWPHVSLGTRSGISKELISKIQQPLTGKSLPTGVVMPGQKKVLGTFYASIADKEIKGNDICVTSGVMILHMCCIAEYKLTANSDRISKTWRVYYIGSNEAGGRHISVGSDGITKDRIAFSDMGIGGAT